MQIIKRILFLISLFILYLILKEFLFLYNQIKALHPIASYIFLIVLGGFVVYFIIIPVFKILLLPRTLGPVTNPDKENKIMLGRIESFRKNKYLKSIGFDFSLLTNDRAGYDLAIKEFEKECSRIRRQHVTYLFYSTSIAQNGFLDALFILSTSINHIKEIFLLFHGRVRNSDLWTIAKKIYYSVAIGGSEGVEYATEEIISKFATTGMKSIPFFDKILSSLADGLVNATLLTRISLITENYCKLTYIRSNRDLYPSAKFIIATAKNITTDMLDRVFKTMRKLAVKFALNKTFDYALIAVNPVGYILGKSIERSERIEPERKQSLKEHAKLVGNPLAYGIEKLINSFKKHK